MTISHQLLEKARAAADRLEEAEGRVQLARTEYHAIVRRMHLAGGSLREIAQALELSHQRVQQIVDGAGGSWWQRVWRSRKAQGDLACTFCQRQSQVAKLIAGPKIYICDACVALAEVSLAESAPVGADGSLMIAREGARARCSFCRKRNGPGKPLLTGRRGNICGECLAVCRQIISDSGV